MGMNGSGMRFTEMQAEINRQKLREREMREQADQEQAAAQKAAVSTEMGMLEKDAQDFKFDAAKQAGVTPIDRTRGTRPEKPIELPASGILPGEEQVTTMDTFGSLGQGAQDGLRKMYGQGSKDPTKFEDWLYSKYGEMNPEERTRAMRGEGLQDATTAYKDRMLSREIINRNARMAPPGQQWGADTQKAVFDMAGTGNTEGLRGIKREELALQEAGRFQRVADNNRNRGMTQAMMNPQVAMGMYARSIANAGNDPVEIAKINMMYNNVPMVREAFGLAGVQANAAATVAAAQAEANANKPEVPESLPDQLAKQIAPAWEMKDPAMQRQAIVGVLTKMNTTPPELIGSTADALIASHYAQNDPQHPTVQAHLKSLVKDKNNFLRFATQNMKLTAEQAEQMHREASTSDWWKGTQNAASAGASAIGSLFNWLQQAQQGQAQQPGQTTYQQQAQQAQANPFLPVGTQAPTSPFPRR